MNRISLCTNTSFEQQLLLFLRLGILSVCVLIPFIYFPQARSIPEHAKVSALGVLLSVLCATFLFNNREKIAGLDRVTVYLFFLFLFFLSLSTLFSVNWTRSLFGVHYRYNGMLLLFAYALIAWIASFVTRLDKKFPEYVLYTIAGTSVLLSVIGFLQYCGIGGEIIGKTVLRVRPHGTLSFVNLYAGFMSFSIPLILAIGLRTKRWWLIGLISLGLLIAVFGIRAASSRGAWLGCLAGAVLVASWLLLNAKDSLERKYRGVLLHWFLIVALIPIVFFPPEQYFSPVRAAVEEKTVSADLKNFLNLSTADRLTSSLDEQDTTRQTRMYLWKSAVRIWLDYPFFGAGPDTFSYFYQQYRPVEDVRVYGEDAVAHDAHNLLLHNLAMWGTLPTLAWIALLCRVLYVLAKRVWKEKRTECEIIVVLAIVFVVDHGSQLLNVNSISLHTLSWLVLGLLIGWKAVPPQLGSINSKLFYYFRFVTVILLIFVAPLFMIIPLYAESLFVSANKAIAENEEVQGIHYYQQAISLFPFREEYWERLCLTLMANGIAQQDEETLQQSLNYANVMIDQFPHQSRFYALRGRLLMVLGTFQENVSNTKRALQNFRTASKLHPVQPKYHAYLAQAATKLQQYDVAEDALEKAIELGNESEKQFYKAMLADLPDAPSFSIQDMK